MRIVVMVPTHGVKVEESIESAKKHLEEQISKLIRKCLLCKKPFLSEHRTRKKYCSDDCRWKESNKHALERYYKRKEKKLKISRNEAKKAAKKALA